MNTWEKGLLEAAKTLEQALRKVVDEPVAVFMLVNRALNHVNAELGKALRQVQELK